MATNQSAVLGGNAALHPEISTLPLNRSDLHVDFRAAMAAAGLDFSGEIIPDGRLHRFKVNGDRAPNSFYTLHGDGIPAGSFGCWKRGIKERWCAKAGDTLTDAERDARDQRWKQQSAERDAERQRQQNRAATNAAEILDAATPAGADHPYLMKKGVAAASGLRVGCWRDLENCLLIPLRTAAGTLVTIQAISPDMPFPHSGQSKDFLRGGQKQGAHFILGDPAASPVILIAEGYATAATLRAATGYAAVMACDAGNLARVAQAIKSLYPYPKTVLICGDNDRATEGNPGKKAAQSAAKSAVARFCIPEFANDEAGSDFNDLAALHGLDAVRAAIDAALAGRWRAGVESPPAPAPDDGFAQWLDREVIDADLRESRAGADSGTTIHPDYCASTGAGGGTFWIKHNEGGDQSVFLSNFQAEIQSETLVDDGAIRTRRLEIAGVLAGGSPLPLAHVASGQFAQLNWVGEQWGTAAQIAPGFGLKDRLRYAIQVLSPNVQRREVFAHTGWREVGGQWVYLSAGSPVGDDGAISGLDVELPGALADYRIDPPSDAPAALRASLALLECAPLPIAAPLFLAPYRAILSEALPVDFSLFLTGTTGSRKTELAALVQAHFGSLWHGKHLPASWISTANRLEQDAFRAKDAVLVVDDFCPGGANHDVARLHKEADRLLRAQGNRAGRARMNADGSPRPAYYPRGLIVATGEDVPKGQSLRGRLLVLEFSGDTVSLDALTTMQQHAAHGRLAEAAGAFCQWVAPRMADLKKTLPARFREIRAALMGAGAHARHPDTLAQLMVTAELWAEFAADSGVSLPADWLADITNALLLAGKEQAQFIATEEPARRFVRLIHAALAAGLGHVKRRDGREPYAAEKEMSGLGWQLRCYGAGEHEHENWYPQGPAIGWFDADGLYLEPDAAYRTAAKFADEQGQALPLSQRALFKALDERGLIRTKAAGRTTTTLWIAGEKKRVLHLSRAYGEKIGSIGSSGSNATQHNDFKHENHGTDSGSSETLSVPSVPVFAAASVSGTDNFDSGTDSKTYRFQSNPSNKLDDKDILQHGTDGTDGTANPHIPYSQVVPEKLSETKLSEQPAADLANRILHALAGSAAGFDMDELCRQCGNGKGASPALIETVLMRLVKAGDVCRINGRWISTVRENAP